MRGPAGRLPSCGATVRVPKLQTLAVRLAAPRSAIAALVGAFHQDLEPWLHLLIAFCHFLALGDPFAQIPTVPAAQTLLAAGSFLLVVAPGALRICARTCSLLAQRSS